MARSLSPAEKHACIKTIISLTRQTGRLTVKQASEILGLHRTTTEKYFRAAVGTGEVLRYGRCGLFRDQQATIDFDLQRFNYSRIRNLPSLPPLENSGVYSRLIHICGAMSCQK
ncbi:DUF977 family protein [Trabulsiella odontotermitis]|uniref:DUF977 family protein n=1 Tax=Trabulsiella odontotermitis TaxID=379893 RepID=UPI003AC174D3